MTLAVARERSGHAIGRSLPALVSMKLQMPFSYVNRRQLLVYTYMLSDILHIVAKLLGSLHNKDIDLLYLRW